MLLVLIQDFVSSQRSSFRVIPNHCSSLLHPGLRRRTRDASSGATWQSYLIVLTISTVRVLRRRSQYRNSELTINALQIIQFYVRTRLYCSVGRACQASLSQVASDGSDARRLALVLRHPAGHRSSSRIDQRLDVTSMVTTLPLAFFCLLSSSVSQSSTMACAA